MTSDNFGSSPTLTICSIANISRVVSAPRAGPGERAQALFSKPMAKDIGSFPRRIICLTEETTETLYLLGEQDRIVGISGYTVRPPEARQKPKVSAFINAKFDKILALQPDLVFAFSDLQADLAAELIRRGVTVFT